MSDFYTTLGVSRTASAEDIKKAYRKAAMQYHPDRNPGDAAAEQKFKELTAAYEVLRDEQKRAAYDKYGHESYTNRQQGGGAQGFEFTGNFADIFDEVFGDFTGGGGRRRGANPAGPQRGADLRYNLEVTLEEAFNGKDVTLKVPTMVTCKTCAGTGAAPGSSITICSTCHGHGIIRTRQGFFTLERTCPTCMGVGTIVEKKCGDCHGHGRVQTEKTLQVTIPAGIEEGTRIRLQGEGEAGVRGASAGDLYIFVSLKPHRFFHREADDLFCRAPIPMATAALGGVIEIPGIDGKPLQVSIEEGTQSGKRLRLRGRGMPRVRSNVRGDMFVDVMVETPVNLTKKQKELLKAFQGACDEKKTSPESTGFLDKMKDLWKDLTEKQ